MRKLSDVSSKYGAPMGRRNTLPDDRDETCKLHLRRLEWVDGDYDSGGAYCGGGSGNYIYWAYGEEAVELFVRAMNRKEAKRLVRETLPGARFYR